MKGLISVVLALMATFAIAGGATAADRWDELLMGDLADDFAAPTASGPVAPGVEFIRGRIGTDDVVDAISFIVPPGSVLTPFLVLSSPPGQTFSSAPFSLRRGPKIDLVISVPNPAKRVEFNSAYRLRRLAVDFSIPILTNLQAADLFVQALAAKKPADLQVKHWAEYE